MTLRYLADENFNRKVVTGLRRHAQSLDVVRVQDVGLRTVGDPDVLEWAAVDGRILLTHDFRTVPDFAYERIATGLPMPGVFLMPSLLDIGIAIEQLTLIAEATHAAEWANKVEYLPLR